MLKFSKNHEWILVEGTIGKIGITDYAQQQLGDIVFVELPDPGVQLEAGGEVAVIESVKAASEIYAPVSGEIAEINPALADDPALVNQDPQGGGWLFTMSIGNLAQLDELMSEEAYQAFVATLD